MVRKKQNKTSGKQKGANKIKSLKLKNLGNVLAEDKEKWDEAVAAYRQAFHITPDYYDAYNNLGALLNDMGKPGEAAVLLRHALRLRPALPEAHNNLGRVYAGEGILAEAEACYQEALRLKPGFVYAHCNLGNLYKDMGKLEEAVASYDIALAYEPESVSAHWNRSLSWLQMGDYERGWPEYEWRWKRKQTPPRTFRQPPWDGSPLAGRIILLWMEQGLGDMIQFIRYAAVIKEKGGYPSPPKGLSAFSNSKVIVECPAFLIPLFSTCPGIDQLVAEGTPLPDFDVQAPLMSLPHLCKTTLATIPANIPYLFAKPDLVEKWQRTLTMDHGPRTMDIGIVWQGNIHFGQDRFRSIPLRDFEPLARLPGVRLISLQKGPGTEQLRALDGRFAVTELAGPLDEEAGGFMDTAAIMQHLDLVVTSDTANAHLAGALGVRVWVALMKSADWRWLSEREDSPWYPTMRLFRQEVYGKWSDVFQGMAREVTGACVGVSTKNGPRPPYMGVLAKKNQ
jgi:hypothetical protein